MDFPHEHSENSIHTLFDATAVSRLRMQPAIAEQVWCAYAQHELALDKVEAAGLLYARGVRQCPHVHLWTASRWEGISAWQSENFYVKS